MIIYIFFQFSSALLWKTILFVGFHFYVYSMFYMLYWNISEKKTTPPSPSQLSLPPPFLISTVLSSWCPLGLTFSLPVKVAAIENRHGTTHCLNTVDHSRWSQKKRPAEKKGPQCRSAKRQQNQLAPWQALHVFFINEPHLASCRHFVFGSDA